MPVPDADAVMKANCPRCKATKGNFCVYTPPPRPEWIPEEEFLARIPTNADLRRRFERAGKPMRGVHQERREAVWRSAPRGSYTIRVDRVEYEELLAEVERLRAALVTARTAESWEISASIIEHVLDTMPATKVDSR